MNYFIQKNASIDKKENFFLESLTKLSYFTLKMISFLSQPFNELTYLESLLEFFDLKDCFFSITCYLFLRKL